MAYSMPPKSPNRNQTMFEGAFQRGVFRNQKQTVDCLKIVLCDGLLLNGQIH
jgi:hypothetical protein